MTNTEHPVPTSDDYEAAGFTPKQVIQLQRLNLALLAETADLWKGLNAALDRLKQEAWLS